jgi:hypothetical protein
LINIVWWSGIQGPHEAYEIVKSEIIDWKGINDTTNVQSIWLIHRWLILDQSMNDLRLCLLRINMNRLN